jgi:cytosine deaminase
MINLLLKNASVQDEPAPIDLAIHEGKISARGENLTAENVGQVIDLKGRLVVPGFVDPHVHLDIALMNSWQEPGRPEPYLSHYGLNESMEKRRRAFTREDIERRASAALELASSHGVTAMRAQCHIDPEVGLKHLEALLQVKQKYVDRITLQIVGFPQQGLTRSPEAPDLYREAFRLGLDVMGGASNLDFDDEGRVDFRRHIDMGFELAQEFDVDLDVHVDLGIPERVKLDELEVVYLAQKTIEAGYQGRVTAGHVCSLDSATPEVAEKAIRAIADAQLHVVSQPDLYRLGRDDTSHVRRGLTRVKDLLAAGVNVTFASNNVRDALRPFGNFNPLEEALILAYGAHMDTIDEMETLLRMCTFNGASALGLEGYGLEVGCQADFAVLDAHTPSQAIVSQAKARYTFKRGQLMASRSSFVDRYNGVVLQEHIDLSAVESQGK